QTAGCKPCVSIPGQTLDACSSTNLRRPVEYMKNLFTQRHTTMKMRPSGHTAQDFGPHAATDRRSPYQGHKPMPRYSQILRVWHVALDVQKIRDGCCAYWRTDHRFGRRGRRELLDSRPLRQPCSDAAATGLDGCEYVLSHLGLG